MVQGTVTTALGKAQHPGRDYCPGREVHPTTQRAGKAPGGVCTEAVSLDMGLHHADTPTWAFPSQPTGQQ